MDFEFNATVSREKESILHELENLARDIRDAMERHQLRGAVSLVCEVGRFLSFDVDFTVPQKLDRTRLDQALYALESALNHRDLLSADIAVAEMLDAAGLLLGRRRTH